MLRQLAGRIIRQLYLYQTPLESVFDQRVASTVTAHFPKRTNPESQWIISIERFFEDLLSEDDLS